MSYVISVESKLRKCCISRPETKAVLFTAFPTGIPEIRYPGGCVFADFHAAEIGNSVWKQEIPKSVPGRSAHTLSKMAAPMESLGMGESINKNTQCQF